MQHRTAKRPAKGPLRWALALCWLAGCAPAGTQPAGNDRPPGEDLVRYAAHLSVIPQGERIWVQVRTPGASDTLTLWLPAAPASSTTLVALSSTQTAMVEALEAEGRLVGIGQADYLYSPALRKAVEAGTLATTAPGGTLDPEQVLALAPTYVLLATNGSEGPSVDAIKAAGITVLPVSDWLETHPLGRMEWILLVGALTGKLDEATAYTQRVIKGYQGVRAQLAGVENRPVCIAGSPYDAVWYVPGGKSYFTQLIQDAGGSYPWAADESTGSLALSLENVLPIARTADVWLNPGQVPDQAAIEAAYPELRQTHPLETRQLYGYYRRVNKTGGNDYFERGAIEPHVVLTDLASLLHPEVLPRHKPVYYRHLP